MKKGKSDLALNKKAFHLYQILEKIEAGIVLEGSEVKSLRLASVSFKDSYIDIKRGEAWLVNLHISKYKFSNINNHEEERDRKLLLNKREINKLERKIKIKGLTIVPLRFYLNNKSRIKLEIGLAQGKKNWEKKQSIKEKDIKRDMDRELKNY